MRIKRGVTKQRRHSNVKAQTKGMQKGRRRSYRLGKQAVIRSLQYSYRDRRTRKRDFRKLWIQRINAAVREHGLTYSTFMNKLSRKDIQLNRKVLSEIAVNNPKAFAEIVKTVR